MHDLDLTFNDIALVPQFNNIDSRIEPDLSSWVTKRTKIGIPVLAANMDTVISEELADILLSYGSTPIFHRFYKTEEEKKKLINKYGDKAYFSVGVTNPEEVAKIAENVKGIVFDIAHGHSLKLMRAVEEAKSKYSHLEVIAGNVCTTEGYVDLVNAGADAVKVGIGPGAACTTRVVTGFGVPQFSAILKIGKISKKYQIPFIADGGIETSGDIVKALAAGASTVMIGKLFALTNEAASHKHPDGFVCYRGQASKEFQNDYYGGMKHGTSAEGVEMFCKGTGSAKELLDNLLGGIRSGFTYGGARDIKELQKKFEYVRVTPSYQTESQTRNGKA